MTTWPASHRGLRALSGRETARVLKLDQVDPVGIVDGDVAIAFWLDRAACPARGL
jgi:hypothetical protein